MNFVSVDSEDQVLKKPKINNKRNKNLNKNKLLTSKNQLPKRRCQRAGGIIYLGHIPHGFYEDEMRAYFSQFGKVLATAVARSKKTGRSKGYGFVQFGDEEVAKIAAETMNNYLMFNKILKCRYIPPEERSSNVVEGTINTSNYPRQQNRKIQLRQKRKSISQMTQAAYLERVQKKINDFKKFFEKNGIDFDLKINDENTKDIKNEKNNTKTSSVDKDTENERDNVNGVLEIDESENEISFKTPPQVKKVFKKSLNSPAVGQKGAILSENSVIKKLKKSKKKSEMVILKLAQKKNKKERENKEKMKKKKELLKKIIENRRVEKSTSETGGERAARTKNEKLKRNIEFLKSKKDSNSKKNKKSK